VPSAAILMIGDNLIKEETVFDADYENSSDVRREISADMFKAALKVMLE
jgi:hypothetical protein